MIPKSTPPVPPSSSFNLDPSYVPSPGLEHIHQDLCNTEYVTKEIVTEGPTNAGDFLVTHP